MKVWYWLVYPVAVILVIIVSISVLFGAAGIWSKLTAHQELLRKQSEEVEQLKTKLTKLQSANLSIEHQNLNYLLQVLPAGKNLPVLLTQIQSAVSTSGAVFEGFSGQVGEVTASESAVAKSDNFELKIVLGVVDMGQLQKIISSLENSLPIVKVTGVDLSRGQATLIVGGVWKPLAKLPAGTQYPISDVTADITNLRDKLKNYTSLPSEGIGVDNFGVNPNPF